MLGQILSLTTSRVALGVALVASLAMCAVPLLGIHGVESALVLGLVLPPLCAAMGARWHAQCQRAGSCSPSALLWPPLLAALVLWLVCCAVLGLNALRIANCEPVQGLLFMVLGPGVGCVLAAAWGVFAAAAMGGSWLGFGLALAGPVGSLAVGLARFYTTPAIFAYDHFVGYFPGPLYDEVVQLPTALLWLRVMSMVMLAALVTLVSVHLVATSGRLSLSPRPGAGPVSVLALLGMGAVFVAEVQGASLGHRGTAEHIRSELGGLLRSKRCEIVLPAETHVRDQRALAADCDFRVEQLERYLGLSERQPVVVYLFRSPAERKRLMGAYSTNIAKPWRHEVYLVKGEWPHPVLHHELAHVLLGHAGAGPFRIAGKLSGLWPDPALIEGMAVAAAWAPRADMTPHQWSRAMLELDLAPSLPELFGAGFLGAHKGMAYTVSGSVMRYLADTHGAAVLRRIYAAGDVQAGLGQSLSELERAWRAHVMQVPLPETARALARVRFAGSSIFSRVCPHRVESLRHDLETHLSAGDDAAAEVSCRAIVAIDPAQLGTRAALVGVLARRGNLAEAHAELAQLQAPVAAPAPILEAARHRLADEQWRAGRQAEALAIYRELLDQPISKDKQRLLRVKVEALTAGGRQAELLFDLLVGHQGRAADGAVAMYLIGELAALRSDGLADYLQARQLYFRQRYREAADLLVSARRLGLPSQIIENEALRVQAISRYGADQLREARRLFWQLHRRGDESLKTTAVDWLARIRWAMP